MDASCGPSSALLQLNKHSQRDNSLQHEQAARRGGPPGIQSQFRGPRFDMNLNREFEQFSGGENTARFDGNSHQFRAPAQRPEGPGWVQDFSKMSLDQRPEWANQFRAGHSRQNQNQHPAHFQAANQNQQQNHFQGQFVPNQLHLSNQNISNQNLSNQYMPQPFRLNMRTDLSTPLQSQMSEHQELHRTDHEQAAFDSEFEKFEQEMARSEAEAKQMDANQDQTHPELSNADREEFARTAGRVKETMLVDNPQRSEATAQKFQQSNFLKLMSSIHDREVELSEAGDKLVDQSGQDIRDSSVTPDENVQQETMDDERSSSGQTHRAGPSPGPNYHEPTHTLIGPQPAALGPLFLSDPPNQLLEAPPRPDTEGASQTTQQSRLPDPLAHIADGALPEFLDPLQAAKIVSGNQVKTSDWMQDDDWLDMTVPQQRSIVSEEWQEMYDDYRNDDDGH